MYLLAAKQADCAAPNALKASLRSALCVRGLLSAAICALVCACASQPPSRDDDMRRGETARVSEIQKQSGQTLAQKRVLDIVDAQNKFFASVSVGTLMTNSIAVSKKRNIESMWAEYFLDHPKDVEAHIIFGKFLRACGDALGAYSEFKTADSIDPEIAVVKQQIAVYEAESGDPVAAYDNILRAVALAPEVGIYNLQAAQTIVLFKREISAEKKVSQESLDTQMLSFYAEAARLMPNNQQVHWKYALSFYDAKKPDWNLALKCWDDILKNYVSINLERQTAMANKARVLIELNRDDEAEKLLEQIDNESLSESKGVLLREIYRARNAAQKESAQNQTPRETADAKKRQE